MPLFVRSSRLLAAVLTLAIAAAISCADSTGPSGPGPAARLARSSGDAQSGVAGEELSAPLEVIVTDASSRPVPGQAVVFSVAQGGGSLTAESVPSDANGVARVRWRLGTVTSDMQRVVAELRGTDGGLLASLEFGATARPGAVTQLEKVSGDERSGAAGVVLTDGPRVRARDRYGNVVSAASVTWTVTGGGGTVGGTAGVTPTDADGLAQVAWTLGPRMDTTHVVTASAAGATALTFTATATLPADARIALVGGNAQRDTVAQTLPESLVVMVTLADGRTLRGAPVAWTAANGTISPATSLTNENGRARAAWTLGTRTGAQSSTARLAPGAAADIAATAVADSPSRLEAVSGGGQTAPFGVLLPDPLAVRALDRFDNVAAGVAVDFAADKGSVSATRASTGADGTATTRARLPRELGAVTITASLPNVTPVRFSATSRAATFASVTTQSSQSCAITTDAYLYCWGQNEGKWLGLGPDVTDVSVLIPTPVAGDHRWTQVDLGLTGCGVDTEQRGWCWGYNYYGTTGSGGYTEYIDTPIAVAGDHRFRSISTGSYDACGLTVEGATYCWGPNFWGVGGGTASSAVPHPLLGDPGFTSISMGDNFACGLTAAGQAYCWGANFDKQLGVGDVTLETCSAFGTTGPCARTPQPVATDLRFKQVVAGTYHACGLLEDGTAYCWGLNSLAQIGDGTQTMRSTPTLASNAGRYQTLDPDTYSTCGVTTAGAMECWGQAYGGLPVTMDACPVGTDGSSWSSCWLTPRNVAAGWTFQTTPSWGRGNGFCGLSTGVLYCWGYNAYGSVGDGTTTDRPTPTKVYGQP